MIRFVLSSLKFDLEYDISTPLRSVCAVDLAGRGLESRCHELAGTIAGVATRLAMLDALGAGI